VSVVFLFCPVLSLLPLDAVLYGLAFKGQFKIQCSIEAKPCRWARRSSRRSTAPCPAPSFEPNPSGFLRSSLELAPLEYRASFETLHFRQAVMKR